jgi:hypothetical protein
MAQYQAISPTAEVLGRSVLAIVGGMENNRVRALQLLAEQGLSPLEPERWYAQQPVLDVFRTIFERIGPSTVRAIGRKVPDWAIFPQAHDIAQALRGIEEAYHANHRGGPIGHYHFQSTGPRSAHVVCENPYPCDFDLGLVEAVAEKNRPLDSLRVRVEHAPGACRKQGADACTYAVRW